MPPVLINHASKNNPQKNHLPFRSTPVENGINGIDTENVKGWRIWPRILGPRESTRKGGGGGVSVWRRLYSFTGSFIVRRALVGVCTTKLQSLYSFRTHETTRRDATRRYGYIGAWMCAFLPHPRVRLRWLLSSAFDLAPVGIRRLGTQVAGAEEKDWRLALQPEVEPGVEPRGGDLPQYMYSEGQIAL